jgi:hypothetical protein
MTRLLRDVLVAAYNSQELFQRIVVTETGSHPEDATLETWGNLRFKGVLLTDGSALIRGGSPS